METKTSGLLTFWWILFARQHDDSHFELFFFYYCKILLLDQFKQMELVRLEQILLRWKIGIGVLNSLPDF
jgi:hypothetical protein